jgi:flagellar biosynthetic protein FlhB
MAENKEERTEEASEKRRSESREKGQFTQSKEVTSAFIMLGILLSLYFSSLFMFENMALYMKQILSSAGHTEMNVTSIVPFFYGIMKVTLTTISPIVSVIVIFAILINIIQGGGIVFTSDPLSLNLSKINPLKGINKIISKTALGELVKSIVKILIVGSIAYRTVKDEFYIIPSLVDFSGISILHYISWISLKIIFFTFLAMVLLAVVDYLFQRYIFEESIKMSKQEIKDERKTTDGDPMVKAKIRRIQMDIARRRMMAKVPSADVVITNPTHFAIAIKYDKGVMAAPVVIAKGTGFISQKIIKIAQDSGVPLYENKPLAQTLYKSVDLGDPIPVTLYNAVAEILAYVYRLKGKA